MGVEGFCNGEQLATKTTQAGQVALKAQRSLAEKIRPLTGSTPRWLALTGKLAPLVTTVTAGGWGAWGGGDCVLGL